MLARGLRFKSGAEVLAAVQVPSLKSMDTSYAVELSGTASESAALGCWCRNPLYMDEMIFSKTIQAINTLRNRCNVRVKTPLHSVPYANLFQVDVLF